MAYSNQAWTNSVIAQINSVPDCAALNKISSEISQVMQQQITSANSQIAQLSLLIVAPTSLPSVIAYLKNLSTYYTKQYTDAIATLTATTGAYSTIMAAIANKQSSMKCTISLPVVPSVSVPDPVDPLA